MAKLAGGVAVLYVGAATEVEMKEKKDRVDDALHATRAAVEEGIVVGRGVALVRAIESVDRMRNGNEDEKLGIDIVRKALEAPLRVIADNSGVEASVVLMNVKSKKGSYGYNARTDVYEDLKKAGVIDPTKVTRIALENAGSIAGMVLMTGGVRNYGRCYPLFQQRSKNMERICRQSAANRFFRFCKTGKWTNKIFYRN